MIKSFLITLLLATNLFTYSQNSKFINAKSGFKNIKLGNNVNNYNFLTKEDYSSDAFKRNIKGRSYSFNHGNTYVADLETATNLRQIGDIDVIGVFVNVVNNKIFKIQVIIDYNRKFYRGLCSVFGEPNYKSARNEDALSWWENDNMKVVIGANYYSTDVPPYYTLTYIHKNLKKIYEKQKK